MPHEVWPWHSRAGLPATQDSTSYPHWCRFVLRCWTTRLAAVTHVALHPMGCGGSMVTAVAFSAAYGCNITWPTIGKARRMCGLLHPSRGWPPFQASFIQPSCCARCFFNKNWFKVILGFYILLKDIFVYQIISSFLYKPNRFSPLDLSNEWSRLFLLDLYGIYIYM